MMHVTNNVTLNIIVKDHQFRRCEFRIAFSILNCQDVFLIKVKGKIHGNTYRGIASHDALSITPIPFISQTSLVPNLDWIGLTNQVTFESAWVERQTNGYWSD